jgi:hypothetical protein
LAILFWMIEAVQAFFEGESFFAARGLLGIAT